MSKFYSKKNHGFYREFAQTFHYGAIAFQWMAILLIVIVVADVVWSAVHGTSHPGSWILLAFISVVFSLFWWILDFIGRYLKGSD
ncbi:hypothetical protein HYT05_00540 [Candidatus Kaiserbacteria bacterium]|nr:hypothetical protein [Candidatus Kaiserbacteria bacterium]